MDTLSQHVTETLRAWVLQGRLRPGTRVEEIPVAEALKVSRTPVRAALAALAMEGLIDHQPKRGYLVRAFALEDILAAYEVRSVLEGLACRRIAALGVDDATAGVLRQCLIEGDRILAKGVLLAEDLAPYQQMNVTLHNTLIQAARNPWVARFGTQAQAVPFASDRIMLWHDHGVILRSHDDHHRIVQAVTAGDAARAEQLMREHVYYAGILLRDNYRRLVDERERDSTPDTPLGPAGLAEATPPVSRPRRTSA